MTANRGKNDKTQGLKVAIAAIAALAVVLYLFTRSQSSRPPAPAEMESQAANAETSSGGPSAPALDGNNAASAKKSITPDIPRVRKTIQELIRSDDLCALNRKFIRTDGSDENPSALKIEVENEYFKTSRFKDQFKDYRDAMSEKFNNDGRIFGYYPRFLAALRKAGWVEATPAIEVDKPNYIAAARELIQLAYEDKGNAAPAAFALALSQLIPESEKNDFTESERDETIALLTNSTHFDSYLLGFARAITQIEDTRAVSLTIRIGFLTTCAIPNWTKFKSAFVQATQDKIELRLKVTDLMIANAKEAKSPSYALGYSIMDSAFAKAIAGGARQYPTFREIDDAFPGHIKKSVDDIWRLLGDGDLGNTCGEPQVEKVRQYLTELKKTESGLGIAL